MDKQALEKEIAEYSAPFLGTQKKTDDRSIWEKQAVNTHPEPELDLLGAGVTGEEQRFESTRDLQEEDFPTLFARGLGIANAARGIFDSAARKIAFEPDPSFDLKDNFTALTAGIPSVYHDKFKGAQSLEEAWDIHRGIRADLESLQILGDNGVKGTAALMLSGVVDIDAILPFLGKATQVTKAVQFASDAEKITLAQKAIKTLETAGKVGSAKAVATVDNVASGAWGAAKAALVTESVLAEAGDTNSWADVPVAMLMAGAFGGAIRAAQGIPVGLSTKAVQSGEGPKKNAATDLAENAADPAFVQRLDDELDDNLNEYTGAEVFGGRGIDTISQRASKLVSRLKPSTAFNTGWAQKFKTLINTAPFADDFSRLWNSGSDTAKALAVSLFESAEGLHINGKSGALLKEHFIHNGYKVFAEGHDLVLDKWFKARGFGWSDLKAKADYTKDLYRRTIMTANDLRLGRKIKAEQDVAEMLTFVDHNGKFVLGEAKGGRGAARPVPGFETLVEQKAHIPLVWSGEAMQAMIIKLGKGKAGQDALQNAIAQAYLDALPDVTTDTAHILAGALINRQITKAAGLDMDIGYLLSSDGKEFMVDSLMLNGMDKADAEEFMRKLTDKEKDAGKIAYARRRTNIDLSGEYNGVKIIDLVEQDLNKIMFQYNDSMSKRIALSRHGLDSKSKIETVKNIIIREVAEAAEKEGKVRSKEEAINFREFLDYSFEYFEPGSINKHITPWMRRARDTTNLSLLGKLGLTQAAETAGIIANVGMKNFIASSRTIQDIFKGLDGGMNRKQVAEDLGWCVGNLGYESGLLKTDMLQDAALDAVTGNAGLARFVDEWIAKGQHLQSFLSGYTKILSGQLQIGALSITNKIFRGMRSAEDMTALLKTAGFNKNTVQQLRALIRTGVIEFNQAGHVDKLNVQKWPDELRDDFGRAVLRLSFQMTQRALPGESMKWLHTPSTAIFGHLQSYPLLAMRKQFLRTAGRKDDSAKLLVAYGLGAAAVATMVKATIEGQDIEVTDVAKRSFAMSNSLSWAATGVDIFATILGVDAIAPGGRYADDVSMPMLSVAKDALHLPGAIASILPGVTFDRSDKRALHILPVVGRMYGTGILFESMISEEQ